MKVVSNHHDFFQFLQHNLHNLAFSSGNKLKLKIATSFTYLTAELYDSFSSLSMKVTVLQTIAIDFSGHLQVNGSIHMHILCYFNRF